MKISIIGGGFMGKAFMRGILRAKVAQPSEVTVAEIFEQRRVELAQQGVNVTEDAVSAVEGAELVLLAVKPQDFQTTAEALQGEIEEDAVVMSIAAGVALASVQQHTAHDTCVRVMPNLPAAVGEAAVAYLRSPAVSAEQLDRVLAVIDAVATASFEVHDDVSVDAVTAISGSGPAYIYVLMEVMIETAAKLGIAEEDATQLVLATVAGAARYAIETGTPPAELREAVTSRGGTTEAALHVLAEAGWREQFAAAIEAAFARGRELGEN